MTIGGDNVKRPLRLIFTQGFLIGVFGLTAFYYLLLFAVTKDPLHPFTQFLLQRTWMSLLVLGFGIQTGLFWLMRSGVKFNLQDKKDSGLATGGGTAVSGISMVACCAHHIVDTLPLVGLSAAALFLSEYQTQFLMFGVLSNFFGITMMIWFIADKPKPQTISNLINSKIRRTL